LVRWVADLRGVVSCVSGYNVDFILKQAEQQLFFKIRCYDNIYYCREDVRNLFLEMYVHILFIHMTTKKCPTKAEHYKYFLKSKNLI